MSHLRVFEPAADLETPEIIPFRPTTLRFVPADDDYRRTTSLDVLQRSRTIHENRQCPTCHHPVVEPLELRDGAVNRNGMPIPGTATLVGFRCQRCDHEWPA